MYYTSSGSRIYGPHAFGDQCIIEDMVVIGHPSQDEINRALVSTVCHSTDNLYAIAAKSRTDLGSNVIVRSGSIIYGDVRASQFSILIFSKFFFHPAR